MRRDAPSAALPLFRKAHSRGEFVFDFSWANAYAQHGLPLLPEIADGGAVHAGARPAPAGQSARRTPRRRRQLLIRAAIDYARSERLSSWHVLFPTEDAAAELDRGRA